VEVVGLLGVSPQYARRIVGRVGADGKKTYSLAELPVEVQKQWAEGQKVVQLPSGGAAGQMALSLTAAVGPNLSPADRAEAEKRYRVIEPLLRPDSYQTVWGTCGGSRVAVIDWLASQHGTARRTIYTWLGDWKREGLPGLIPSDRADKGKPKALNAAALEFILAAAFPKHGAYGKLTIRDIFRSYMDERAWRASRMTKPMTTDFDLKKYARYLDAENVLMPSAQLPLASYQTFCNWFNRIPEVAKIMAREGDEAYHNSQEIISFREISAVKPMDYLVMDHRRLDFFCLIPQRGGWTLARPWLTAAIDMRTRKWLAWAIVETPSSDSIAVVLKRTFLDWGIPAGAYWDNGKDFRCEWLEGGKSREESRRVGELETGFRGVLDTLGVRVTHAIVRRARSKIIEPNFGRTADFDRTLPWWCGHQPGARPTERFDKLLAQHERWMAGENVEPAFPTIEQVAAFYSTHLEELNERDMVGAEGMAKVTPAGRGWMCPNEAWERLIKTVDKRVATPEIIHIAFAKRKQLRVTQGEIRTTFGGQLRHYRPADNPIGLAALNGQEVSFAYDPLDLQTAAVYHEDRLVGLVECIDLRRMGEDAFVEDEKLRRTMRREVKAFIANVHQAVHVPDHYERSARREVVPRLEPARRLVSAVVPAAVEAAAVAFAEDRVIPDGGRVVVERVGTSAPVADGEDEFDFFA